MEKVLLLIGEDSNCLELISLIAEGEYGFATIELSDPQDIITKIDELGTELHGIFNTFQTTDILSSPIYQKNHSSRKAPYSHILDVESINPVKYQTYYAQSAYNFLMPKEKIHKEIHNILSSIEKRYDLDKSHTKPVSKEGKKLYKVKSQHFLSIDIAKNDIYIKIGSGKFIKLFLAGAEIDKEKINSYISKGQKFLYQAESDYMETVSSTLDSITKKFNSRTLNKAQTVSLQLTSIKEVQDAVRNLGITQQVIDTTDGLVKSVENMLKSSNSLKAMVKKLLILKSRFFTRTSINNYLLGGVADKMAWESHKTLKKLIYASVFCDFSFEAVDVKLAEVLSLESDECKRLTKVQQLRIKTHPKMSAALMEKSNKMMTDEVNIILHHHEKPDGSGFPTGLDYKTLPVLSCAFILCYDFTTLLMRSCSSVEDIDVQSILNELGPEYTKANFAKPYQALKELLKLD